MLRRLATAVLQLGVIAVALAVLPYKLFELDRYFVPKELVLHAVALLLAILLLVRVSRTAVAMDAADVLMATFLFWSLASALFAPNHWLAQRALGISVSGGILFWGARRLSAEGAQRHLLHAAAAATLCAVVPALAQAYGLDSEYFSYNRAPGGTFGNRNFVAHFTVIGLPALVYTTVTVRRSAAVVTGYLGAAAATGLLVLSRSRAAWLALLASGACVVVPLLASRKYWRGRGMGSRVARLALAGVAGGCLALILPNRLRWTSQSPYLESARSMVDYQSGSGRGRVAQYVTSLQMSAAYPVFGVGPGNWPVRYVRFARRGDPSVAANGMTANPWPSSDWVAFVSERGAVAALALLGAFVTLWVSACRRWSALPDAESVLARLVLVATIPALLVASAFDAVLLLAAPSFLAWTVIGAASAVGGVSDVRRRALSRRAWIGAAVVALIIVAASLFRSAAQAAAIVKVGTGGSRAGWLAAASLDPGSYRINLRAAQLYLAGGRCSAAEAHAQRAAALFPSAAEPERISRWCGRQRPRR